MPTDYRCKGCGLRFSVGWYHLDPSSGFSSSILAVCRQCCAQHRIDQAMDLRAAATARSFFDVTIDEVPAPARTAVMANLRARLGLTPHEAKRLVDQPPVILGRDLPERAALELRASYASLGAIVGLTNPRSEPIRPIPQEQDRLLLAAMAPVGVDQEADVVWESLAIQGARAGVTGVFNLAEQPCARCATIGTLTTDPAQVPHSCSRCRSSIEETGGWVT